MGGLASGKTGPILLGLVVLLLQAPAKARVVRLVVEGREAPAFKGQSFGAAGLYVKLVGRFFGELDPKEPLNARPFPDDLAEGHVLLSSGWQGDLAPRRMWTSRSRRKCGATTFLE